MHADRKWPSQITDEDESLNTTVLFDLIDHEGAGAGGSSAINIGGRFACARPCAQAIPSSTILAEWCVSAISPSSSIQNFLRNKTSQRNPALDEVPEGSS